MYLEHRQDLFLQVVPARMISILILGYLIKVQCLFKVLLNLTHVLFYRLQEFVVNPSSSLFDLSRWSQFTKAIRVVAWILIFVHNSKPRGCKIFGSLTGEELDKARIQIIYT